jgi:hypothetical protein
VQESVAPEESKRLQDTAEGWRREAEKIADAAEARRQLSRTQRNFIARVRSFVRLSSDADKRGDMRQAYELANRALVLAKELQP